MNHLVVFSSGLDGTDWQCSADGGAKSENASMDQAVMNNLFCHLGRRRCYIFVIGFFLKATGSFMSQSQSRTGYLMWEISAPEFNSI